MRVFAVSELQLLDWWPTALAKRFENAFGNPTETRVAAKRLVCIHEC